MTEQTLNIPQLLVVTIVVIFIIRWYFSSPNSSAPSSSAAAPRAGRRVNPAQVEQVAQIFPHLNRRDIAWDLQRNGGNVAATSERVLSEGGLETAPPSFQPQLPPSNPSSNTPSRSATPAGSKASHPDLITRYNLASKLNAAPSEASSGTTPGPKSSWSTNKQERQQLLQKRREEMILAARRKLEEKDRAARAQNEAA